MPRCYEHPGRLRHAVPALARPAAADWLHEIKHEGFRLMVQRRGSHVCLFTRNGHDWAARYPAITAAAAALQVRSFLIDGEVVVADARGVASFSLMRGRAREKQAFVWALTCSRSTARTCAPCR